MNEYVMKEAIRKAVAAELARRIDVTEEMIQAQAVFEKAQEEYRQQVRKAVERVLGQDY